MMHQLLMLNHKSQWTQYTIVMHMINLNRTGQNNKELIVIDSSSKANCYLIKSNNRYLAIETGCAWNKVEFYSDFNVKSIDCALISHIHGDHSKYCEEFVNKGFPVYAELKTALQLEEKYKVHVHGISGSVLNKIYGGYIISLFGVPHENIDNSAFIIQFPDGERLFYATDFEYIPHSVKSWNINHFLIGINRTEEIPEYAEAREHRIRGHSNLETVEEFLSMSITNACKSVTACHLSSIYADPDKVMNGLHEVCGDCVNINIARKGRKYNLDERRWYPLTQ